jgi:hypothetical protein
MTKLINKIIDNVMPYKVILEDYMIKVGDGVELQVDGFIKRFRKFERVEEYVKRKMEEGIFDRNCLVEDNTYNVYPGRKTIAKVAEGI